MEQNNESNVGPLIGTIIVFLILVAGGVYLLQSRRESPAPAAPETTETGASLGENAMGIPANDDISTIEADFSAIETQSMDAELGEIDKELQ